MRAPPEMNFPNGYVLQVLETLYGVPKAAHHWYLTSDDHHHNRLCMKPTRDECCLFFRRDPNGFFSLKALQVDDGCGTGSPKILELKEEESERFLTKPRIILSSGTSMNFNGARICFLKDGSIFYSQQENPAV